MWFDCGYGVCSSDGATISAQMGARVTSRVDPEWLDREVCLIVRNLQKYFYFHKKELPAVLESCSLFYYLEKMGHFLGFRGKKMTVLSPYCGLIRKMLGKNVGFEFFPVLFWFLKAAERSFVTHTMTGAASLPRIQNIPIGCTKELIGLYRTLDSAAVPVCLLGIFFSFINTKSWCNYAPTEAGSLSHQLWEV